MSPKVKWGKKYPSRCRPEWWRRRATVAAVRAAYRETGFIPTRQTWWDSSTAMRFGPEAPWRLGRSLQGVRACALGCLAVRRSITRRIWTNILGASNVAAYLQLPDGYVNAFTKEFDFPKTHARRNPDARYQRGCFGRGSRRAWLPQTRQRGCEERETLAAPPGPGGVVRAVLRRCVAELRYVSARCAVCHDGVLCLDCERVALLLEDVQGVEGVAGGETHLACVREGRDGG